MVVLSLFDGMSCGLQALKNLKVPVTEYHAWEIDKYAIAVAKKNHPEIIHHGDVTKADFTEFLGKADLVLAGSPCQGFSFGGKQLNFEDPRSKLYFEFERCIAECQPKHWLLENVKMKKEYSDTISRRLGRDPISIDSAQFSAQRRKRLYWTSVPVFEFILNGYETRAMLKNIVHEYADGTQPEELSKYMVPMDTSFKYLDIEATRNKIGYFGKDSQANRVYKIHGKGVTLCGGGGGGAAKMGQYLFSCNGLTRVGGSRGAEGG